MRRLTSRRWLGLIYVTCDLWDDPAVGRLCHICRTNTAAHRYASSRGSTDCSSSWIAGCRTYKWTVSWVWTYGKSLVHSSRSRSKRVARTRRRTTRWTRPRSNPRRKSTTRKTSERSKTTIVRPSSPMYSRDSPRIFAAGAARGSRKRSSFRTSRSAEPPPPPREAPGLPRCRSRSPTVPRRPRLSPKRPIGAADRPLGDRSWWSSGSGPGRHSCSVTNISDYQWRSR